MEIDKEYCEFRSVWFKRNGKRIKKILWFFINIIIYENMKIHYIFFLKKLYVLCGFKPPITLKIVTKMLNLWWFRATTNNNAILNPKNLPHEFPSFHFCNLTGKLRGVSSTPSYSPLHLFSYSQTTFPFISHLFLLSLPYFFIIISTLLKKTLMTVTYNLTSKHYMAFLKAILIKWINKQNSILYTQVQ